MPTFDPQTGADAAERVQAVLDARPQDDRPSHDVLYTIPDPNDPHGWLHLTGADLRALLADRARMATELERIQNLYRVANRMHSGAALEAVRLAAELKWVREERDGDLRVVAAFLHPEGRSLGESMAILADHFGPRIQATAEAVAVAAQTPDGGA